MILELKWVKDGICRGRLGQAMNRHNPDRPLSIYYRMGKKEDESRIATDELSEESAHKPESDNRSILCWPEKNLSPNEQSLRTQLEN